MIIPGYKPKPTFSCLMGAWPGMTVSQEDPVAICQWPEKKSDRRVHSRLGLHIARIPEGERQGSGPLWRDASLHSRSSHLAGIQGG